MKIVGPYTSPTIYSEHPGIVELTSSDPSVASVDASVTIPGTRVWRNGLKHGQYLSCDGAATASRNNFTLFVAVMTDTLRRSTSAYTYAFPIGNLFDNGSRLGLTNWGLCAYRLPTVNPLQDTGYFAFLYTPSPPVGSSSTAGFSTFGCTSTPTLIRLAVTYNGTTLRRMINSRTVAASSNVTISGTCGSEYLVVRHTLDVLAKLESVASDDDLDAWFADGTLPAGLSLNLSGGHEIVEDAPVFWDSAGTNDLKTVAIPSGSYPAAASGDYTDDPGDPVVPFQPFTITPNSTGTFTITARRRRQGVPDRATDEEKYETTSETFTITEMPAEVVQYVRLLITTSTPGTVDIASSDPLVVTFPASVVVGPTLQYEVLGTVVGAGTSIITTSMGGAVLDTTTVTIEAEPTIISSGPPQNLRSRI